MSRPEALLRELRTQRLWLGGQMAEVWAEPTGHAGLDALLPGSGWPYGALSELLVETSGCGELSLLVPALARLTQAGSLVALINPPYIPYAPALTRHGVKLERLAWLCPNRTGDALWSAEQTLRSGAVAAVLLWSHRAQDTELRRLQLAAETGNALGFIYRRPSALKSASPAALRLLLEPTESGLKVDLIKVRGGQKGSCTIPPLRTTTTSRATS